MFSEVFREYAEDRFQRRLPLLGELAGIITETIGQLSEERAELLKFFYGTMPLRDAGEYQPAVFLTYVDHGLWLRENMAWCRKMPEDLFLHYVLYYRINTEGITPCREFFYEQLKERIRGKTMAEAVLEVNYWCAEQAGYEASDNRTLSPMGVYRSGSGRCGEESAFAVSALRSVGIPARQVYAPWWAHCDDNHAWVEVYVEGDWHFLGACEPEEALDLGWFVGAASRALLVHSRTFFDYWLPGDRQQGALIGREGSVCYFNSTPRYASIRELQIQVTDQAGRPAAYAQVSIQVLNMAEYMQLARLCTDESGRASLTLGLGSVHIHAWKEGWLGAVDWDTARRGHVTIRLCRYFCQAGLGQNEGSVRPGKMAGADSCDIGENPKVMLVEAPKSSHGKRVVLTREQKKRGRERRRAAMEKRKRKLAASNIDEIETFLLMDDNPHRRNIVSGLSAKDRRDVTAKILEAFLEQPGIERECGLTEKEYVDYVLCPRIYEEELTPYPPFLRAFFSEEQKAAFAEEPAAVWDYIASNIREDAEETYETLLSTPMGCLKLRRGTVMSRKILFVAICRSLGIPARICPDEQEAEFWREGRFWQVPLSTGQMRGGECRHQQSAEFRESGRGSLKQSAEFRESVRGSLKLSAADGQKWNYHKNWTIGRLVETENGDVCFKTLHYDGIVFEENRLSLELEEGIYRLIAVNRFPNGNQQVVVFTCSIKEGRTKEIFLPRFEEKISDLLCCNEIEDFEVMPLLSDRNRQSGQTAGENCRLSELTADRDNILAFLEVGQEPTEHVLNEILVQWERLFAMPVQILFLLRNQEALENPTLQEVLKRLPQIRVFLDPGFEHAEQAARAMYVEPETLPLLIVTRPGLIGSYSCSGYNVGSVDLIIKILSECP